MSDTEQARVESGNKARAGSTAEGEAKSAELDVNSVAGVKQALVELLDAPKATRKVYLSDTTLQEWGMKNSAELGDNAEYKSIAKAYVKDEVTRMGVSSDFHEHSSKLNKYRGENITLVVIPGEDNFDHNYLWVVSPAKATEWLELRQKLTDLEATPAADGEASSNSADAPDALEGNPDSSSTAIPAGENTDAKLVEAVEADDHAYEEKFMAPRPWVSLGSEQEVHNLTVRNLLPSQIGFSITQARHKFGKAYEFNTRDPGEKIEEYKRQQKPSYDLERQVLEVGFQAAPQQASVASQTNWRASVNKINQYEPISYSEAEKAEILGSVEMATFLKNVSEEVNFALQQNETLDLFKEEFKQFEDEEVRVGNRSENNLKELHSFNPLKYAKGKTISCVNWHPDKQGVVAFSCTNNHTFDEWVEFSGMVLSSWVLIWNFADLLHPELVLKVPGDLYSFSIHPTQPHLIAGGLKTGQVIFWNLKEAYAAMAVRKTQRSSLNNRATDNADAVEGDAREDEVPPVDPISISYIDRSHGRAVLDIQWLDFDKQVNRKGDLLNQQSLDALDCDYSTQFQSSSTDGNIIYWDIRIKETKRSRYRQGNSSGNGGSEDTKEGQSSSVSSSSGMQPAQQSVKEMKWLPVFTLPLLDPRHPENPTPIATTRMTPGEGEGNETILYTGTEDGDLVIVDWQMKQKLMLGGMAEDQAKLGIITKLLPGHFQHVSLIEVSPHFPDIILTVADWRFIIWKIGMDQPLFESYCADEFVLTGRWSPTRPGVIVTGKADGTIDIWDLFDQCHKPSLHFTVGSDSISTMEFWQNSNMSVQYLAVGDQTGKLHIVDIPRALRRPLANEEQFMKDFYEREITRVKYFQEREELHSVRRATLQREQELREKQDANAALQNEKKKSVAFLQELETQDTTEEDQKAEQDRIKEQKYQEMLQTFQEDYQRAQEKKDRPPAYSRQSSTIPNNSEY